MRPGDGAGDRAQARVGFAAPGKAFVEHKHFMGFAMPFAASSFRLMRVITTKRTRTWHYRRCALTSSGPTPWRRPYLRNQKKPKSPSESRGLVRYQFDGDDPPSQEN